MRKTCFALHFLVWVFFAPQCFATGQQIAAQNLFSLIDQRLSFMEDVAVYKAQRNIAIEDRRQEALVLEKAVEAAARSGVDGTAAERFFRTQIDAAKSIQKKVLERFSTEDILAAGPRDLNEEIRPELISLGESILRSASDHLVRFGPIAEADYPFFQQGLSNVYLDQSQARELFDALRTLRPSENLPGDFVDVRAVIPDIQVELRYYGDDNFLGEVVDGYFADRLILTAVCSRM